MSMKPLTCKCCGELIFPGNDYTEYDLEAYCNASCLATELVAHAKLSDYSDFVGEYYLQEFKEYLMENADFSRRHLHTDEEMENIAHEE